MQIQGKFLDILRSRTSLAAIVGEKVKLTRKGREFLGICPFHHEKTPSFTVSEEKEFYHCFGCGAHGDAIRFLVEIQHYSFMEAVKELATRAGLALPQEFFQPTTEPQENLTPLKQALQAASEWFHKNLFLAKNREALHYIEQRGLTKETIKRFILGYAPDDYQALKTHLMGNGFSEEILLKAGLLTKGEGSKASYDRFRKRILFPIHDHKGQIVAFGGRFLGKGEPKYLNSPETPLFSKGKLLYGYFFAKEKLSTDPLIIVEGYMDVIALHQAGYKGTVAPLGTALTEDQILLAWRLSPEPILCFDGDAAGLKAAERAAERTLPLLKPGHSLQFSILPQGEDPDSLVQKGANFEKLLAQAYSLLDALWMFLTYGKTFKTPEKKTALQAQYALWSQAIQNADVRKSYQYAFKNLFYQSIIGTKEGKKPLFSIKKRTLNFLLIYEHLLIAILINHPNLLDEISDDFSCVGFQEQRLHEMREAILLFYAEHLSAKINLKEYLLHNGFENEVTAVLAPQILIHGAFASPSASLEDARNGWKELFNRIQGSLSKNDLKVAQDHLADKMSLDAWNRLKMLKKSLMNQD